MPTAKPLFIPKRIAENPDLTQEQKEAIALRLRRSAASRRSARQMEAQAQKQKRKDDDHRKILSGAVAEAEAAENKEFAAMWKEALKKRVRKDEQFLFKELWPDATRPVRLKVKSVEQTEENSGANSATSEKSEGAEA